MKDHQALKRLQVDIKKFEKQYKMGSNDFYQRWIQGEVDDRMDFVEWASLFQMLKNFEENSVTKQKNHE